MRRLIALILAVLMLCAVFSGCAAQAKEPANDPVSTSEKEPPVITFLRKDANPPITFDVKASGYSWHWDAGSGVSQGAEADAIHPLDPAILNTAARTEEPFDVAWILTFEHSPAKLSYDRWDYGDIGDTDAPARESGQLREPYLMNVKKSSVYVFHARFADSAQGGGSADYYLVTGPDAVIPEVKPVMDAAEFMMSDGYADWWTQYREAMILSTENQAGMDDYYAQILPLLLADDGQNAVCSPLNVYLALAMLAETAGSLTQQQILDALHAPDPETLRQSARAMRLANNWDTPMFQSLIASSLWVSDRFPVNGETVDAVAREHGAEVFSGKPGSDAFDLALRQWTNEHTKGLLKEYADGMHMDPETMLELVSTLYFKAAWGEPFSPDNTTDEVFHGVTGDAPCRMMRRSGSGAYYFGEGFAAVQLGLSECGSMIFFLPDEGTAPDELLYSDAVLSLMRGRIDDAESEYLIVNLGVPRFDVKEKTDLKDVLLKMGVTDAFDAEKADFSPLSELPEVFLSKAEHAAALSVDEEGVTGAAYTDLGLCGGGMPPEKTVDFILDRPFLFAVTARDGSILFAGIVRNMD